MHFLPPHAKDFHARHSESWYWAPLVATGFVALAVGSAYGLFYSVGRPSVGYGFLFLFAIMGAAWWGGLTGGILASVESAVVVPLLFVKGFDWADIDWPRFFLLLVIAGLVSWAAHKKKATARALELTNEELEARVRERTATLETQIAEKMRIAESLRETDEQLRMAMAAGRMGNWMHDLQSDRVTWSDSVLELFGLTRDEFDGNADIIRQMIHPEDWPGLRDTVRAAANRGGSFEREFRIVLRDGTVRWLRSSGQMAPMSDNSSPRMVGITMDITETKTAQEALGEREETLRAYFEAASQGIVVIDEGGGIVQVNRRLAEMFGYRQEELTGQRLEILLPERFRRAHDQHRSDYFRDLRIRPMGTGMSSRLVGLRQDGTEFPVEIGLSFAQTKNGLRALGLVSDISERESLEEAMRQTQKLESLGILAGGISHDFNNLLVGILGNASLVLDSLPAVHQHRAMLEEVVAAGRRAADLTRQLLAYAGKGKVLTSKVDLTPVTREIIGLVHASIPKSARLELDLAEELPVVDADVSQLQQIIMNLVINAGEAIGSESAGVIRIRTGLKQLRSEDVLNLVPPDRVKPGRYVFLEVQDTGCGMSEQVLGSIFDPFFTTKFTGRGLGLSAVLGIIKGHSGALRVVSEPGKGSSFTVYLPVSSGRAERPVDPGPPPQAHNASVLVVDDELVVRRAASQTLSRNGYKVVTASDGKEALKLFAEAPAAYDLVLLDLTMPGMSGQRTLEELWKLRPDLPVILSSGFTEEDAVRQIAGGELGGFLQKPYTSSQLLRITAHALRAQPRTALTAGSPGGGARPA